MVFDGRQYAEKKEEQLRGRVERLRKQGVVPKLVWVCVGEAEQNLLYGRVKRKAAERLGIEFEEKVFADKEIGKDEVPQQVEISQNFKSTRDDKAYIVSLSALSNEKRIGEVVKKIKEENEDPGVHGVMVQLPIQGIGDRAEGLVKVLSAIDPEKDVDCLTPENLGRVIMGRPRWLPATVKAVMEIVELGIQNTGVRIQESEFRRQNLEELETKDFSERGSLEKLETILRGKRVVVVGAGLEVGRPLVAHLSNLGASVLWVTRTERNLGEIVRQAEILISATGRPGLIKEEMVAKGAMVIDVGSPKGDVEFEPLDSGTKDKVEFITPVPGGVGPVTVACLMENVVRSAEGLEDED